VSILVNTAAGLQTTTVTLAASATTVVSGQSITLTAAVAPASATGTLSFLDGNTSIGSASLTSGKGMLTLNTLSVGSHSLSAAYSGDAANAASTSNVVAVTIAAAGTAPGSPSPSPDYGLTLSSGTLTVAQSTPGSLTVKVAPENGFNAALSFACSGLPSGWGCSFAPATVSGGAPQSTTMTVSTTNSAQWMSAPAGLVVALVSPLPLFWFGFGGKSRKARWVLLFVFILALAGCGTSGNTSQKPQEQSSTYNITVTASGASAPTRTQTFVLTVMQ
jgi:hypothetical protein